MDQLIEAMVEELAGVGSHEPALSGGAPQGNEDVPASRSGLRSSAPCFAPGQMWASTSAPAFTPGQLWTGVS